MDDLIFILKKAGIVFPAVLLLLSIGLSIKMSRRFGLLSCIPYCSALGLMIWRRFTALMLFMESDQADLSPTLFLDQVLLPNAVSVFITLSAVLFYYQHGKNFPTNRPNECVETGECQMGCAQEKVVRKRRIVVSGKHGENKTQVLDWLLKGW